MDSPDWRLTQKWISVEVPWRAEFEQKFRIVLKKESPVVLVLSQLDDRYFDGLQGQYSFRLQFRLHDVNSPGEEDYIVRSHGNYLMDRSVVTELKSLKTGTYSVFIMVVADRDVNANSVEDVVKAQCQRKVHNDKLAQVGMAYDIAHSKGAHHMESQAAVRKAKAKAKARESRIAIRRKAWEKRHASRMLIRKQTKKNDEKRERNEAKDEAAEAENQEKDVKDQGVQTEDIKEVIVEKEDKVVQTEDPPPGTKKAEAQPLNENDKAVQVHIEGCPGSTTSSQGTPSTPKSSSASSPLVIRGVPMHVGPPPPPPGIYIPSQFRTSSSQPRHSRQSSQRVQQYIASDGESSASPVSDYGDIYNSDDDHASRNRQTTPGDVSKQKKGSDDEDDSEPWNAVCIVGFRVYSKDEALEVKLYEDGEEYEQIFDALDKIEDEAGSHADDEDREAKKEKVSAVTEVVKEIEKEKDDANTTSECKSDENALLVRPKEDDELAVIWQEKEAATDSRGATTTDDGAAVNRLPDAEIKADTPTKTI